MRDTLYAGLAAHKQKHDDLRKEVQALREKCRTGQAAFTVTLSNFLARWLCCHIKEDDLAMIQHVQAQANAKAAAS